MSAPSYLLQGMCMLSLVLSHPLVSVAKDDIKAILARLSSEQVLERRQARKELTGYLERTPSERSPAVFAKLLDELFVTGNDRRKIGICIGLAGIKNIFWHVDDQDQVEERLYKLYQRTTDPTFERCLDDTLMRAQGLYWDAINDYNQDVIGSNVEAKFRRVFESFSESAYADKAQYYLARYFTRAYIILKNRGENPSPNQWLRERSNATFTNLIQTARSHAHRSPLLVDAQYFMGLNFVLLGDFDEATKQFEEIVQDSSDEDRIYVYQFFYSRDRADVVDQYYPAIALATHTLGTLQEARKSLAAFVDALKGFSTKEFAYQNERFTSH